MSQEELRRVEVLPRVKSGQLRVADAVPLLRVSALSRGRCWGPAASQRGASLQPCLPAEVSAAGARSRSGTGEVRWAGGEAFWTNAGGRALGSRRWTAGECRDAAAVDAGSGAMEPGTEAAEA